MLKGAPYRKRNRAAAVGDTIHRYAEAVARNEPPPEIDTEHEPFVGAFLEFLEEFRPRFRVLEGIIFRGADDDPLRFAGTFDFLADVPDIRSEGARWVTLLGDYKTGGAVYAEVALQLAALRAGDELWDPEKGDLLELPAVDACVAVGLRPDEYKVHLVDAGDAALDAFMGLRAAWPWEKDHTNAVGPTMNLHRLLREIERPVELEDQLRLSVEQTSGSVAAGVGDIPGPDPEPDNEVAGRGDQGAGHVSPGGPGDTPGGARMTNGAPGQAPDDPHELRWPVDEDAKRTAEKWKDKT